MVFLLTLKGNTLQKKMILKNLLNALENVHYSERGILLFANILNTKNIYIHGSDSSLRTSLLLFGFNQKNDQGQQMVKLHSACNLDIHSRPKFQHILSL